MMLSQLTGAWNYPTRVLFGPGRISELAQACTTAGMSRPLVVTDRGLASSAILEKARRVLRTAGVPDVVFSDVQSNPSEANLAAGIAAYKAGDHDGVVAFGGGSGLDVGKLVAMMHGQLRPVWDFEDVGDWWTRADPSVIAPIIAIPTTAGTGSEVGRASVLTNETTHEKKIIFHPLLMPKIVVADPELTVGLSPLLTAATGFDALAHCIEALCAASFHPIADGIALEGIRLIAHYLPRAYRNGADIEARAHMLAAASAGATAFQKGLGAVHSISHPCGAFYDTHHGLTNGVVLPYVLVRNRAAIEDEMARVSRVLNLGKPGFDGVLQWVLSFRDELGIPHSLSEIGVKEDRIADLASQAVRDPSTNGNPIPLNIGDFEKLIMACIRGDLEGAKA